MGSLADFVFTVHLAVVVFIVGGLGVIWLGAAFRWPLIRNFWFRGIHLAAICFVALQTLLGQACPLTLWEDALRQRTPGSGFIERWVSRLLYFDLSPWVFTLLHAGFAGLVIFTWWRWPPESPSALRRKG